MTLSQERIIVMGGSQGIGEAAVRGFGMAGAEVFSLDVNAAPRQAPAQRASAIGPGTAKFLKCDVSNRCKVDEAFVQRQAPVQNVPDETLSWIYSVNVKGTIYTNGALFRHMESSGGAMGNFGSESGLTAEANNAVYRSSKAAVTAHRSSAFFRQGAGLKCTGPVQPVYQANRRSAESMVIADREVIDQDSR